MTSSVSYFEPASRLQLAEKMRHLLHFSDMIILLIGDENSGRTRLMQEIDPGLDQGEVRGTQLTLDGPTDVSHLLTGLAQVLPLDCPDQADNRQRLRALNRYSRDLHELGVHLALLIDDANYLSDNALELLTNFATLDEASPSLLMSGSADFEERFQSRISEHSLEGRVHTEHLTALSPEESSEFINQVLPADASLTDSQREKLIRQSEGLPGRIISQLELILKEVPASSQKRPVQSSSRFPIPNWAMLGVVVILVGILGLSTWFFMPRDEQKQANTQEIELPVSVQADDAPEVSTDDQSEEVAATPETTLEKRLAEQEAKQPEAVDEVTASPRVTEEPVEQVAEPETAEASQKTASTEQLAVAKPEVAEPSSRAAENTTKSTDEPAVAKAQSAPEPTAQVAPNKVQTPEVAKSKAEDKTEPQKAAATVKPKAQAPKTPAPQPSVATKAPATQSAHGLFRGDEILQWPDSGYTLQFLAAREVSSVNSFIKQVPNAEQFYPYDSVYKGKPWRVIVYGQFKNRKAAMAAARNLPRALRKFKPWARSIASIKADIKKKK